MQLAGRWNWWLPQRLDRLIPRLSLDSPERRLPKPADVRPNAP
jgi:hypothetical protein